MKKEKDIQILRGLCVIIALAAGTLSVLYLLGIFQLSWCLNCIMGLGLLFHGVLFILLFLKHQIFFAGIDLLAAVFYLSALVYFNL